MSGASASMNASRTCTAVEVCGSIQSVGIAIRLSSGTGASSSSLRAKASCSITPLMRSRSVTGGQFILEGAALGFLAVEEVADVVLDRLQQAEDVEIDDARFHVFERRKANVVAVVELGDRPVTRHDGLDAAG